MATSQEIANSVRRNLDDLGAGFYDTAADIFPSLQDGYNLIVALTESIEKQVAVNFRSGVVYYDFTTDIPDYLRIFGIYNNNTNRWLYPTSLTELYRIRNDWELANGEPYLFLPIDYKTVALFPSLDTATGSMTVMYKAKADTLTANSTPEIPQEQVQTLEFSATEDLLTQCEEWIKAIDYMDLTNKGIDQIQKVLRERSSPNHLYYKHSTF